MENSELEQIKQERRTRRITTKEKCDKICQIDLSELEVQSGNEDFISYLEEIRSKIRIKDENKEI